MMLLPAFTNLTQRQTNPRIFAILSKPEKAWQLATTTIQRLLELLQAPTDNHTLLCLGFTPGSGPWVETSRPLTASGFKEARRKPPQVLQTRPRCLRSMVFNSGY